MQWQARRKLNRDPAASTSLSVACRYASLLPSVPTTSQPYRGPGTLPGSPAFVHLIILVARKLLFSRTLAVATWWRRVAHRRHKTLTRKRKGDKICHQRGDVFCSFALCAKRFHASPDGDINFFFEYFHCDDAPAPPLLNFRSCKMFFPPTRRRASAFGICVHAPVLVCPRSPNAGWPPRRSRC